jgi:hypothetical protein
MNGDASIMGGNFVSDDFNENGKLQNREKADLPNVDGEENVNEETAAPPAKTFRQTSCVRRVCLLLYAVKGSAQIRPSSIYGMRGRNETKTATRRMQVE